MPNAPQTLRRYYSIAKWFSDGFMFPHVLVWERSKSGFGVLGPENASRSRKSITFVICFGEHFDVPKMSPQARAMEPQSCLWFHSSRALLPQCFWTQRSQWLKCCYWCTPVGRPQNARRINSPRSPEATVLSFCYPYGSTIKCNKILFGVTCWGNFLDFPNQRQIMSTLHLKCFLWAITNAYESTRCCKTKDFMNIGNCEPS